MQHNLVLVCVSACDFAHARVFVEGNKHIGTIHQLSTCDQRFGDLMTVRFNDHRPPQHPRWDTIVPEEGWIHTSSLSSLYFDYPLFLQLYCFYTQQHG